MKPTLRKAFLACLLIAGLASTAASEELTCQGRSLMQKAEATFPEGYRRAVEAAAKVPNGDHVFWEIKGEGSRRPSWLFGTIHVNDDRVRDLPPPVAAALQSAVAVAVEIAATESRDIWTAMSNSPELLYMPDGREVWPLLKPDIERRLRAKLETIGADLSRAGRVQPWLLSGILSASKCSLSPRNRRKKALDGLIVEVARKNGAKVVGLETIEEQMAEMARTPLDAQVAALAIQARSKESPEDVIETLIDLYLSRRIGLVGELAWIGPDEDVALAAIYSEHSDRSMKERNVRMVERSAKLLADGGAFIAVGAGHLPGEGGLVELVRRAGYTVSPVD